MAGLALSNAARKHSDCSKPRLEFDLEYLGFGKLVPEQLGQYALQYALPFASKSQRSDAQTVNGILQVHLALAVAVDAGRFTGGH